jgi:hypothetical protein
MYGKYSKTGFIFLVPDGIEMYGTGYGETFNCMRDVDYQSWPGLLDFLLLPIDAEEAERLRQTCDACAKSNIQFNAVDLLLIHVPFRDVEDTSLFSSTTLNNAQSVILIMRECLKADNPLKTLFLNLHSKLTFVETIYDHVRPHTQPVLWSAVKKHAHDNSSTARLRN